MDISKDEIPTDKGFVTRKMISDVNIIEDGKTPIEERPYTGEWDIVTRLRGKKYPKLEPQQPLGMIIYHSCCSVLLSDGFSNATFSIKSNFSGHWHFLNICYNYLKIHLFQHLILSNYLVSKQVVSFFYAAYSSSKPPILCQITLCLDKHNIVYIIGIQ